MDPRTQWSQKLRTFLPAFLREHVVLAEFAERGSIILHGYTCRGVDDPFSDLDLYLMLPDLQLAEFDRRSSTRFHAFQLDGKPGHINASSLESFTDRVEGCDMELISELRSCLLLFPGQSSVNRLLERARQPMRPVVRHAFFFYHYFQLRNFHRAADNPMERGDGLAVLMAVSQAIAHALRAALVLDGVPYPYEKWLRHTADQSPTGQALMAPVKSILDAVADDVLRQAGPQSENPISNALRAIRVLLIDAAHTNGIDEPWLKQWWLYIPQAEAALVDMRW